MTSLSSDAQVTLFWHSNVWTNVFTLKNSSLTGLLGMGRVLLPNWSQTDRQRLIVLEKDHLSCYSVTLSHPGDDAVRKQCHQHLHTETRCESAAGTARTRRVRPQHITAHSRREEAGCGMRRLREGFMNGLKVPGQETQKSREWSYWAVCGQQAEVRTTLGTEMWPPTHTHTVLQLAVF